MINEERLQEFAGKVVGDVGAFGTAGLVVIGDKLGLYKAMAGAGPIDADELAERTETHPRYIHEWLSAQVAAGYIAYDAATQKFTLPAEHAMVLAEEASPANLMGGFVTFSALMKSQDKLLEAFRGGHGVGWHEHHEDLFEGCQRLFQPGYDANLVDAWIPALDGVKDKLERGAVVADVGCGHGASTIIMAKAFPNAQFIGFDVHEESLVRARQLAQEAGVADRCRFERATAKDFPGQGYDLVCFFDCLHDMGDPAGASAHVRQALAPDGTWMIVEPFAGDALEENVNPVGRIYYAASTMVCTPCSLSQEVGLGLGAQAGEERIGSIVREGGFTTFRRATESPLNLVLEARL